MHIKGILIFKYSQNDSHSMAKKVIEASQAVAEAVKLCRPEVIPVYPITPQRV